MFKNRNISCAGCGQSLFKESNLQVTFSTSYHIPFLFVPLLFHNAVSYHDPAPSQSGKAWNQLIHKTMTCSVSCLICSEWHNDRIWNLGAGNEVFLTELMRFPQVKSWFEGIIEVWRNVCGQNLVLSAHNLSPQRREENQRKQIRWVSN